MTERALKQAFVIQYLGSEDSECRQRADRVLKELIEPVCQKAFYKPVRAENVPGDSIVEPIISALATSPMVIADLGDPPLDDNFLVEVGFRLASGRPIVFLVDETIQSDMLPLHLRDRDAEIVHINSDQPSDENRRKLGRRIRAREKTSLGWQSHYPMVEFAVPLTEGDDVPKFVSVNAAAAKLYGVKYPHELLAMPVEAADERLKKFMPEVQRKAFTADQEELFVKAISPANQSPAMAKIPAWLPSHPVQTQQTRIYWPILLQHKFSQQDGSPDSVVMRVAFVPVERWEPWGPEERAFEKVVRVPELFREPKFKYDIFLSYNSDDYETVSALAAALESFKFRIWFDRDDLSDRCGITPDLVEAISQSRIFATVLGSHGFGPWQHEEFRIVQNRIRKGKVGFALLLTHDMPVEHDQWLEYVPRELRHLFKERLYLPLEPAEDMNKLASEVKKHASSGSQAGLTLVQRMVKLLSDAIHAD